jgi:hypothetical protein
VRWGADQRKELEHLCRYITRPAIANERLKRNRAGDVVLQLKSAFKDGTTHIVMAPLEFMQRLVALVPHPRLHLIRFHGVLAHAGSVACSTGLGKISLRNFAFGDHAQAHGAPARMSWARLLKLSLRYRHRALPELRRQLKDHRRHRRSAGDCQNPYSSGPADPRPGAGSRFIPDNLRAENRLPTQADGAARSEFERAARSGTLRERLPDDSRTRGERDPSHDRRPRFRNRRSPS